MEYKCTNCDIIEDVEDEERFNFKTIKTLKDGTVFKSVDVYCQECGNIMTIVL